MNKRKKKLLARLDALKQKKADLVKRSDASEDLEEVRSLNKRLQDVAEDISDVEDELAEIEAALEEEEARAEGDEGDEGEERGKQLANESRSFKPMASYNVGGTAPKTEERDGDPLATMEYRTAFKNYIQRGEIDSKVLRFAKRDGSEHMPTSTDVTVVGTPAGVGTISDLGVLIPSTIMDEILKDVQKVYGQLYSRVRKTNVPGAVKYPIGSFGASFKRITETGVSARQDAGGITGTVEFSYKIGEIRLARTLLQSVLSVPMFEEEFAKVIAEAYVEAMDKEIMVGVDANNQMEGILTEAAKGGSGRIPTDHIIDFTAAEMADWTSWQTKLFAKIPLAMRRARPEFAMTANTYEANIKTLKDDNNRPVYAETYNPVDGDERATFKAREVVFVEDDILKNFDDAANGEYFGMYWVPEQAYAINTNMQFTVVDYFDQETNQWVKKALVINDGKPLNTNFLYLLRKKVTA